MPAPVAAAFAAVLIATLTTATASDPVRFNRDIRPILSDNCFACHGPDPGQRKAKLRLDTRDGLFQVREDGAVVKPGHAFDSLMIRRITAEDPEDVMPPHKTGKRLTPHQKELLQQWIASGADWAGHWAYQPVRRPAVPEVEDAAWPENALDHFILHRLESEGLRPSPEADRRTLIRRLSFDVTGLPPEPGGVDSFESGARPGAWEELVDQVLASPHFGERMALHWLDLVRYADTDGFHADNYRSVWPYRDYVIRAFNDNKPFDRFTLEQVAGDLLPDSTLETRVASTYNRLGRSTEEGGAQPKEYLAKYAAERVRSLGTVWLGSTIGCAECHDHKFDPYTTQDFYRLAAYFADIREQGVGVRAGSIVPDAEQEARLAEFDRQLAPLERRLGGIDQDLETAHANWIEEMRRRLLEQSPAWEVVSPLVTFSTGAARLELLEDRSILSSGENPEHDSYTLVLPLEAASVAALRLETLTHPDFPKGGLSRGNGNFVLTDLRIELLRNGGGVEPVEIERAIADFSQEGFPIEKTIDDRSDSGWAVAGQDAPTNHQAVFHFFKPLLPEPDAKLIVRMRHDSKFERHNVGRFRIALSSLDQPTLDPEGMPAEVAEALRIAPGSGTEEQARVLERRFLETTPLLADVRKEFARTRKARADFVAGIPTTLMTDTVEPRVTRILPRGNWMDDSGEIVEPGPPRFLNPESVESSRRSRLDLAHWLVSRDNPLTARVMVNRWWRMFFGVGLSKDVTDFGVQGEWPRHPELLDWLAAEFIESGWDVKHIVRTMVTSAAYRQTSLAGAPLRERDPYNRLHARQARFRLDAESIRDNALAVGGLLVREVGGPSVKPYQPEGYWDHLNFPKRTWKADENDRLYRRGLYVFWCRTFLHPSLLSFDACPREESTAERVMSNTPLQALTLLNDPIYVEAARAFAEQILRQGGDDSDARLQWAFHRALSRPPEPDEARILAALLESELERYAGDPEAARLLSVVGALPAPKELDLSEVAAWTAIARTLLNLDESVVRN